MSKELARLRIKAHAYFDLLWQNKLMTRKTAYNNLVTWLGLSSRRYAHIKLFNQQQCEILIVFLKQKYPSLYEDKEYLDNPLFYP